MFKIVRNSDLSSQVFDHRLIRFKMAADPRVPKQNRNPLSTDWSRFKTELVSSLGGWEGNILTTNDIESNVNLLQTKLITVYEAACPLRAVKPSQNVPYWSSDLAQLREKLGTIVHVT
jgi:hypothetical protein